MSSRGARSDAEAAYFTLLRARDEHTALLRYQEYLEAERARLDAFAVETQTGTAALPRLVRRPLASTVRPVLDTIKARQGIVTAELRRLDERLAAAAAFVEECELELDALRA